MSFWTKRRKFQAKIEKFLQNVAERQQGDYEAAGMASDSGHGSHLETECPVPQSDKFLSEDDIQDGQHFEDERERLFENHISEDSSDFSESLSEQDGHEDLRAVLRRWAVDHNITQTALGNLLGILRPYHKELPKDPRTLLSVTRVDGIRAIGGGFYFHFGIADGIKSVLKFDQAFGDCATILLQVNVDGLPLFKSSSTQFWPILGRLPQATKPDPFAIGIFSGNSKPSDAHEFLHDFVQEAGNLQQNGIFHNDRKYQFCISNFVCDAPARAYIKGTKGHSGYSGCDKCTQHGEYVGKMTFPETDAALRTDASFDEMVDEEHHVHPCPFRGLQLGMVSQFPLDYMHLICLGVMKRIILFWMKGPLRCRLGGHMKATISEVLVSMKRCIPKEFARKPRTLGEVDRWKATEFRLFLLYTGPVALKDKIAKELYDNFMLLSVAIHILASPTLHMEFSDYAHSLLVLFVEHFSNLYGPDTLTYNVHCVVHLAQDVKKHGHLDLFSAFPFESFLGHLKKLVRKPNFVLEQVIRRLIEKSEVYTSGYQKTYREV